MNFLGVGLPEMLVIFAVALLVFGPRKLPEIGRTLAKTLRSLQDASREFEAQLNKEFEAQLNKEAQELEKATRGTTAAATPKASRTAAAAEPKAESVATADTPTSEMAPPPSAADDAQTADAA